MRLVCPKCVAQYEVDEQAIPDTGREVQCANCEHIWFQDSIQMHPERDDDQEKQAVPAEASEADGENIFEEPEGVQDAVFKSARESDTPDAGGNLHFSASTSESDEIDDDEPMDFPGERTAVDPAVLDVLRNEAAFSSARAKLDAAAAQALDQPPADTSEPSGLTSFLAEHLDPEDVEETPETDNTDMVAGSDAHSPEDSDAVPDRLAEIEKDDPPVEYQAILPQDDPVPESDPEVGEEEIAEEILIPAEEGELPESGTVETGVEILSTEADTDEEALAAITAALGIEEEISEQPTEPGEAVVEADDEPLDIESDIEEEAPRRTRRTYRADGAGQDFEEDSLKVAPEEEDVDVAEDSERPGDDFETGSNQDEPEDLPHEDDTRPVQTEIGDSVSAALGAMRPRVKGGSVRARTIPGAEAFMTQAASKTTSADSSTAPEGTGTEQHDKKATQKDRPPLSGDVRSRKELLPDVEELDSTLRGGPSRSKENLETIGDAKEIKGGGFRSSFIRALFLVALCVALYVFRPQIIDLVPAAAVVLDPYANFVDSVRLTIDGFVTKMLG